MSDLYRSYTVDAQTALTEFSNEFAAALAVQEPTGWAQSIGVYKETGSIKATFPVSIHAAGYHEYKGNSKFRDLFSRSLSVTKKQWQDGVEAMARVIESDEFSGWNEEPANIAREGARQPAKLVAAMLNANPLLDIYKVEIDGAPVASAVNLFHAAHPVNMLDASKGTFDNDETYSALDDSFMQAAMNDFLTRKGSNGESLGLTLKAFLIPPELLVQMKKFLESDLLLEAVKNAGGTIVSGFGNSNVWKGTVELIVAPELSVYSTTTFYGLDTAATAKPWVLLSGGAPEERVYDKTSDKYKDTGLVAVSYILDMGVAAALPHAITRYTYSA